MRLSHFVTIVFLCVLVPNAHSQNNEVNRQNRTVEIIATEKVQVVADVANVTLGCVSYGQTHDQAYQANLKAADSVIKAILGAGVQKTQIESSSIELGEDNSGDGADTSTRVHKTRQFKAHQSWRFHLSASDAQKIVDISVQAGANGIEYVSWDIADPEALETKARTTAMVRARRTATEMAQSGGGKLGDMLYASNSVSGIIGLLAGQAQLDTTSASLGSRGSGFPTPTFTLQLFPEKIEKQVTVREIFALE
ncbi:MAG TPA: SIMPL domain-containing protein [Candidatus Acidoferrales bacterium]|jgi:hypothetical protein|nr:SIMPL domain-containing protein [Candidatus Acidoferrales bacterium]